MRFNNFLILSIAVLLTTGCKETNEADTIIQRTIETYFPSGLVNKQITFDFRDRSYSTTRYPDKFIYTRAFEDSIGSVKDILTNSTQFVRLVNDDTIELTDEWSKKYTSSVNAVLYFFQIPFVLNDPAANKELLAEETINDKSYWKVLVTFDQESGGAGYEDHFLYWIDRKSNNIDYLAYNYSDDGGGVRFREAINRRKIDGITFQDYINFEVPIGTPLENIPGLYTEGKLKELSRIINENIVVFTIP
ncbi:MAG: DUF6503 family protein [Bacteroidota bacterium]